MLKTVALGEVRVTALIVQWEPIPTHQVCFSASSAVRANIKTIQARPGARVAKLERHQTLLERSHATNVVQDFLPRTVAVLHVRDVRSENLRLYGAQGHATLVLLARTVTSQGQQGVHYVRLELIPSKKAGNGVPVVSLGNIPHE